MEHKIDDVNLSSKISHISHELEHFPNCIPRYKDRIYILGISTNVTSAGFWSRVLGSIDHNNDKDLVLGVFTSLKKCQEKVKSFSTIYKDNTYNNNKRFYIECYKINGQEKQRWYLNKDGSMFNGVFNANATT